MRIRDKIITAVSRTVDGIEWTSLKRGKDGPEPVQQKAISIPTDGKTVDEILESIQLPEEVHEYLKGDITVPLRTADLLMRVMELPSIDDHEISDMVGFQIDKISPFSADQLTISHEVLQKTEETSLVLMAAAKRSCIDAIGDTFEKKGVRIHSIDARVLGWMKLLQDGGYISSEGCEIFILDDGIDFALMVIESGIPLSFRMLNIEPNKENIAQEVAYEIGYTLTTLDSERNLPSPSAIQLWSYETLPADLQTKLSEKTGLPIHSHSLSSLPPLSEGIVRRTLSDGSRIELIPREWVDHENRKQLRKKFTLISSAIATVWLIILLTLFGIYKARAIKLSGAQKRVTAIESEAKQALENRQKLKALKVYTDRSDSALECLREVTNLLPAGDIEFVSYNYKKGKGVTLRGTSNNDGIVDDFFITLAKSPLFEDLKDHSVNAKITKGIRRSVFSVTLVLPSEEIGK